MLLSWFLFCVSCVASRYASAPPFSSRRLFLSLAPFAAALWARWPLFSGPAGGPTGSPRSIRFLCVVLLLRVMITLRPVSLLTCLVYTRARLPPPLGVPPDGRVVPAPEAASPFRACLSAGTALLALTPQA